MLVNIKSKFFCRIIFSYLEIRRKFEIVKYNKNLQKTINISLLNYKIFSGIYIIYGENDKGKGNKFQNDLLIFKGEYLNGKRNGKRKRIL